MMVQLGKSVRKLVTLALVAFMMFASLLTPATTVAQTQTVQSSLTGVTISYGAPYVLQEDGRFLDESMETMMFLGAADVLAMGFMSPLIDLNGARDILLQSLFGETGSAATIDRGDYTGVSYSLDMLNIDGLEMGVFSLFMNQRSHGYSEFYIFLAPPAFFGTAMQTAQNSFTINGGPLMDGVDAMAMGNMVTANIGITGGSAVTDVTDVTDNTSETSSTGTTQSGSTQADTGDTAEGDGLAYLLAVGFEFAQVEESLTTIWKAFTDLSEDKITAQEARVIIDEQQRFLSGTNDRIALIEVPASMQDFHQETLVWSDAITNSGVTWFAALDGTATQEQSLNALNNATEVHLAFGERLAEENIIVSSGSGSTGTTDTNETTNTGSSDTGSSRSTRSTDSTQSTTTSSTDASGYIEAVNAHRAEFVVSLGAWNESFASLGDNPTDAQLQQVRGETLAEAEYWITFSADAQQLTPPAGYEDVHAAYLNWAAEVTELGNLWIGAMNGNQADLDAFSPHLQVVADADGDLNSAISAAGQQSGDTSTTSTSETAGTSDTDTGSSTSGTSSRTSRSTGSNTSGNTSETSGDTSRTTRSTGTSSTDDTGDTGETTSRTTRSTRSTDTSTSGNTSETSGQTSTAAVNEWFMEATGATITWSDDFFVSTTAENPQTSDIENGEDRIVLVTTTPEGTNIGFSITVFKNDGVDSTAIIAGLVDVPDAVTTVYGDAAQVLEYEITPEQSAALIRTEDEIGPYYVYVQITCVTASCDTVALLSIPSEGYPLLDTLEAIDAGVAIDGISISSALPRLYIEEVVEEYGN